MPVNPFKGLALLSTRYRRPENRLVAGATFCHFPAHAASVYRRLERPYSN